MKTMFSDKHRIKLEINKRKSSDAFKQSTSKQSVSKRGMTQYTELDENENTKYKNICVSWNSAQCYAAAWMGGEGLEENGYKHIPSLFTRNYHSIFC